MNRVGERKREGFVFFYGRPISFLSIWEKKLREERVLEVGPTNTLMEYLFPFSSLSFSLLFSLSFLFPFYCVFQAQCKFRLELWLVY